MKFDHILFAIDFSDRCSKLNKQVEWLAGQFNSRVTLLHVFETPAACYWSAEGSYVNMECFNGIRECAEQRLKDYAIDLPAGRVERVMAEGNPAIEIMKWVEEHKADLIVMGTHGYGALQGWILGSVTAKLLHRAECPIWTDAAVSSTPSTPTISNILCAIELTEEALPLLRFTGELAAKFGAAVKLLHSVPELETRPSRYFDFDLHRYLVESARVEIGKLQRQAGTEFPFSVSGKGIASALAEAAKDSGADLVVIGRGKAQKMLGRFQTHAYNVIRHAPCPVLSYSLSQQDHISSSCSAEHLCQSAEDVPLLTGSQRS
jgi:nucleotide-binding universal stress UspA family protein